jgi:hypothetical protein
MQPQVQMQGPDDEGGMARADLYRAAKHSMKLFQMIQNNQQLEGWVQAKITKAADYLDSIYHYMEYQVKFGQGAVASSVDDITGDMETAARAAEEADDDKKEMEESMNYEQRLQALLESAVKKAKKETDKKKCPPMSHIKKMCQDGKTVAEICKMHPDCDQKELKQMVADCKKKLSEGFPTVASAKKDAEGTAGMKPGEKKKSSTGGTIEKTKTGVKHTAGKNYSGKGVAESDDKCNHTAKGKKCPVHGLKECGTTMAYEAVSPKDVPAKGSKIGKEGNAFGKAVRDAKAKGAKTMTIGGKDMPVKEGERTMSRAAKGHEKYGKEGMAALAKAGKEGKSLEPVRAKYNKYDESADKGRKIAAAAIWKNTAK